jgi:hypothetical protein
VLQGANGCPVNGAHIPSMGMIFPPAVMFHSGYSYEDMVGITRYNHQKDRNSIQAENETKDRGFEDLTQRKKKHEFTNKHGDMTKDDHGQS